MPGRRSHPPARGRRRLPRGLARRRLRRAARGARPRRRAPRRPHGRAAGRSEGDPRCGGRGRQAFKGARPGRTTGARERSRGRRRGPAWTAADRARLHDQRTGRSSRSTRSPTPSASASSTWRSSTTDQALGRTKGCGGTRHSPSAIRRRAQPSRSRPGAEIGVRQPALVLVDRALVLGRRQRQPHRHRRHPRHDRVGLAAQQQVVPALPIRLRRADQRPGVGGAILEQQQAARLLRGVGCRAVDRPHMVDADAAGRPGAGHRLGEVDVDLGRVHGAAEHAVAVVVVDRPLVAAGHAQQRAVLDLAIVHHHADGAQIVVGVRIERPVLVPLDRGTVAGGLHVQLRRVEADRRAHQLLQHRQDVRVTHHRIIDRVMQMRRLDPPHPRFLRAVRRLEVIDLVVLAHEPRLLDQLVGHPTQIVDVLRAQHVLDDHEPLLAVSRNSCLVDHRPCLPNV